MTIPAGDNDKSGWRKKLTVRGGKLGSDEFCKIGPAAVCIADNPKHIAPKSPIPTWEHQVSEKRLPVALQGHFPKIYCSQIISSTLI